MTGEICFQILHPKMTPNIGRVGGNLFPNSPRCCLPSIIYASCLVWSLYMFPLRLYTNVLHPTPSASIPLVPPMSGRVPYIPPPPGASSRLYDLSVSGWRGRVGGNL